MEYNSVTTGESIGQVASQTMEGLIVSDDCADRPVFRPLIAMDKVDIMDIAREIGTYETSILPYEDCCTIFVPKHPKTKPQIEPIRKSESVLNIDELLDQAIEETELAMLLLTLNSYVLFVASVSAARSAPEATRRRW